MAMHNVAACIVTMVVVFITGTAAAKSSKPHIIFIVADDLVKV